MYRNALTSIENARLASNEIEKNEKPENPE